MFNSILYFATELGATRFEFHWLTHLLLVLSFGFMGHLIAGVSPNRLVAGVAQLLFVIFNVIMAGSFVPVNIIPDLFPLHGLTRQCPSRGQAKPSC